jgi:O-antigen/teichoic acid export membrane protein
MPKKHVREGIWVGTGQLLSAAAALVSVRVLTGLLTPASFGQFALLLGIVTLCQSIVSGPWAQSALYFLPRAGTASDVVQRRSERIVLLSAIPFCIVMIVYWLFGGRVLGGSWWSGAIMALLMIVETVRPMMQSFLSAHAMQRAMSLWSIADSWLRLAGAMLMLMIFPNSPYAVLTGYIAASVVVYVPTWFALRRIGGHTTLPPPDVTQDISFRAMARYALPLFPLALCGWISAQGDRYIIGALVSVAAAGNYAAIYGLVSRPFLLAAQTVQLTLRPEYYQAVTRADTVREREIERRWLQTTALFSAIGFAAFCLLQKPIAELVLAPGYRSYAYLMPWLAAGYALLAFDYVYERVCYAYHDTRAVMFIQLAGAAAGILLGVGFVWKFGMPGAAFAVPFYFGLQLILAATLARRWRKRATGMFQGIETP